MYNEAKLLPFLYASRKPTEAEKLQRDLNFLSGNYFRLMDIVRQSGMGMQEYKDYLLNLGVDISKFEGFFDEFEWNGNLFDSEKVVSLAPTSNGLLESPNYQGFYRPAKPGEQYVVSRDNEQNNRFAIKFTIEEPAPGVQFAGGTSSYSSPDNGLVEGPYTVPGGYNWVFVYLSNDSSYSPATTKIKLEKGSEATGFYPVLKGRNYFEYEYLSNRDNFNLNTYSKTNKIWQLEPNQIYTFHAKELKKYNDGEWGVLTINDGTNGIANGIDGNSNILKTIYNQRDSKVAVENFNTTFVTPESGKIYFSFYDHNKGNSPDGQWFTDKLVDAQIFKGKILQDWKPAPEDTPTAGLYYNENDNTIIPILPANYHNIINFRAAKENILNDNGLFEIDVTEADVLDNDLKPGDLTKDGNKYVLN